jgi:hypothetical protein
MRMRRLEADRMSICDLGMTTALIIPAGTATVMGTPRLKQGIFGLDVFLPNFLRHKCDSQHKKPKVKFLSLEVNPTSLTSVSEVVPGDLFLPTFRAATMARYFHCLLRYS